MANTPVKNELKSGGVTWTLRWHYGGLRSAKMERVTWSSYRDIKSLKTAVESRGHMVRDSDPDVLDRSIVTDRRRPPPEPDAGPTFFGMYGRFMAEHPFHKPSTVRAYKFHMAQLEGWHDRPVKEITESDARLLWNWLRAKGDPRAGMRLAKAVMNFARKVHEIDINPCDVVVIPKARKSGSKARFLAEDEYEILRSNAVIVQHRGAQIDGVKPDEVFQLEMDLVWETGLRSGEVSALEPKHVKIRGNKAWILVRQTATRTEKGWEVGTPKSEQGIRDVDCSVEMALRLLDHHKTHNKRFIFPSLRGGLKRPDTRCQRWKRVVLRANKNGFDGDARFHDLRHAYASNLLMAGVPIHEVSVLMGHSSIQVTVDCYGHIGQGSQDRILAATQRKSQGDLHVLAA
jgi:integrase